MYVNHVSVCKCYSTLLHQNEVRKYIKVDGKLWKKMCFYIYLWLTRSILLFEVFKSFCRFFLENWMDMQFPKWLQTHGSRNCVKCAPFEDVAFSIKNSWLHEARLEALVRGMFQADFNIVQQPAPSLTALIAPTNLNEMCCCVDSRRRWPLSRSKHLS